MRRLIERAVAEPVVVAVILINAVALFVEAFPKIPPRLELYMDCVDWVCTLYFVLEVIAKHWLLGRAGYWSSRWNRFDFVVIMLSSPALLFPHYDLRVIGVFRAARLLRFFRLLRFIPNAPHLWAGVRRALKASIGVVLAAVLYNFVLGLLACYLFGGQNHPGSEYFSDPLTSIYSIFKVFSVEGWYEIPDAIAAAHGDDLLWALFVRAFFVFAVITGGMLGFSLLTAVFVDQMLLDNTLELEQRLERVVDELHDARKELKTELLEIAEQLRELLIRTPVEETKGAKAPHPPACEEI